MDRNLYTVQIIIVVMHVALRKESVDRNNRRLATVHNTEVALRKESVDRNDPPTKPAEIGPKSLSARRAWIEISRLDAEY